MRGTCPGPIRTLWVGDRVADRWDTARSVSGTRAAGMEGVVELLRAQQEKRDALIINDPQPFASLADLWGPSAQMATVGIFVLLLVTCLYFCRPILLPVFAAVLIGTTFAPILKFASRYGVSPWVTSIVIVALMVAAAALAVTLLAAPITEWMGRAPEIGASIKQRLYVFDRPLAAFHELESALRPAGPPSRSNRRISAWSPRWLPP